MSRPVRNRAYFVEGRHLGRDDELVELAAEMELDADKARTMAAVEGPQLSQAWKASLDVLTSLTTNACAATVSGVSTTYCFLLDEARARVLASVAIDPPGSAFISMSRNEDDSP